MGHLLTNFVENPQELFRAIGTAHVLEDLVRSRLQRHMQLRAHSRRLRHGINNVGGELGRVRRGKTQALEALNLAYLAQQLGKGEAITRQVWVCEVDAIGVDVLP